jgi:replicative DNA helicase
MASEIVAVAEKKEKQRKLEEAFEKIKTLETACSVKDEVVRQTQAQAHLYEVAQSALVQKMAEMAQALMSPRAEAATSTRINAFDGFNSDLTLQLDAARSLNDALRQQMRDEQERYDALQKQLVREKEQVRLLAPTPA